MPKGVYARISADERFEQWVDRSGEHHLWKGALNNVGYANFWFEGRYIGAHVYAWERERGPLPLGEVIRHRCRHRHCVRLDHLESGTKGDNNRDRQRDGTQTRGNEHHNAILTDDAVRMAAAFHRLGVPWNVIGRRYLGVPGGTVHDAVTHRRGVWRHVDTGY